MGHIEELLSTHLGFGQSLDVPVADLLLCAGPAGHRNQERRGTERNPLVENEAMARQERGDGDKSDATGAENPVERSRPGRRQLDDMVEDDTMAVAMRLRAKADGHEPEEDSAENDKCPPGFVRVFALDTSHRPLPLLPHNGCTDIFPPTMPLATYFSSKRSIATAPLAMECSKRANCDALDLQSVVRMLTLMQGVSRGAVSVCVSTLETSTVFLPSGNLAIVA